VSRPSPRAVGPIVMIVPLLSLIAGALWMRERVHEGPPPGAPSVADPDVRVAGWRTPVTGASPLVAELFPLHADDERQAFEAERLRERLDLGPGEPFRLRLSVSELAPELDPSTLRLTTGGQPVLTCVRPGPDAFAGPLATLLWPPARLDPGGRIVEIVLWGSAPDEAPTLCVDARDGTELSVPLETTGRPRRELPAFLARLDPGELGKEGGAASSQTDEESASD